MGVKTKREEFEEEPSLLAYRQPFEDHETFPDAKDVLAAIPKECFVRSTLRSATYLLVSLALTFAVGLAAWRLLPTPGTLSVCAVLSWTSYALIEGTIATGVWVVAHECGHGAFSDNKILESAVGYIFHSLMLVPYHSWQRSHAVHHAKTNHVTLGETHVPNLSDSSAGRAYLKFYSEYVMHGGLQISQRIVDQLRDSEPHAALSAP